MASHLVRDRRLEEASELAREVDRHARVHGSLLVEEALRAARAEHAFVPHPRMNIEALVTAEAKADELLRRHVVAGPGERHVERPALERKEELPSVRMIVGVPEHHASGPMRVILARQLRRLRIGQDVVSVDGLVAAVQDVATPLAHEHAFGRAALIAGACVDRTSAERRPANDLDAMAAGVVDEMAVAL